MHFHFWGCIYSYTWGIEPADVLAVAGKVVERSSASVIITAAVFADRVLVSEEVVHVKAGTIREIVQTIC